ncbi:hypothetical protein J1614_006519 [Plenodomus biglobosus]|nr:hypothetical protein J1614_006519 [Plenodomus biglobosus]
MPYLPSPSAQQANTPVPTSFLPSTHGTTLISIPPSTPSPTATPTTSTNSLSPTLPTHSKAGSNNHTDIVAGTFVGLFGFLVIAFWLHTRAIPWLCVYPARIAAINATRAERHELEGQDREEHTRDRYHASPVPVNQPEHQDRLANIHVPTVEQLAHFPPTIRPVHGSSSGGSLQNGIDAVQYGQRLCGGECSRDGESCSNIRPPPNLPRISHGRASSEAVQYSLHVLSDDQAGRIAWKGKGRVVEM